MKHTDEQSGNSLKRDGLMLLNLPFPPSVNTYWRANGHRRFISKAGVDFKQAVAEYVIEHEIPKYGSQRLGLAITIYGPNKRKFDLDNRLKAVLDALQDAGVFDDDEQVDILLVKRGEIVKNGLAVVIIGAIDNEEDYG